MFGEWTWRLVDMGTPETSATIESLEMPRPRLGLCLRNRRAGDALCARDGTNRREPGVKRRENATGVVAAVGEGSPRTTHGTEGCDPMA